VSATRAAARRAQRDNADSDQRPGRKMPTAARIAEYWAEWEQKNNTIPPWCDGFWDWYEPSCMACNMPVMDIDPDTPTFSTWNKAQLERCHVVPRRIAGLDGPQNLVLMCHRCHKDAPESANPDDMWVYMRERTSIDCLISMGLMTARAGELVVTHKGHQRSHLMAYLSQMRGIALRCECKACGRGYDR